MGLFKNIRSKNRSKDVAPEQRTYAYPTYAHSGRDSTKNLPNTILELVFSYVCPHALDYSYESSEKSQLGDGCMLCDLRDLGSCAQVSKRWFKVAQRLLYTSIRIDAVHYCALEEELAVRRKKNAKHFKSKTHIDPGDVPGIRLGLLCRTLRDERNLGCHTQFLKLPYMTREACKSDLARTVSACPNLRYVDLPDGFYSGDASCEPLRQELQAQCPNITKMVYRAGAETQLEFIVQRNWQRIEILELSDIAIAPGLLQLVLASLPLLRDLTLSELPWMDDVVFEETTMYPAFPPVQKLKLDSTPNVTASGLEKYLSSPKTKALLASLTLQNTGVTITELHKVLWRASALQHLTFSEAASRSVMLTKDLPTLASISLKVLTFEIEDAENMPGMLQPSDSYYTYLASSLHASALPALSTLYVRDQGFPERLLLPLVPGHLSDLSRPMSNLSIYGQSMQQHQQSSFNQTLEVFSKGVDELEWVFTAIRPPSRPYNRSSNATGGRPLSAYSASKGLGPQWAQGGFGGGHRKSVIVGDGFGGYLAVPTDQVPKSYAADRDASAGAEYDMTSSDGGNLFRPPPSMNDLSGSPRFNEKRGSKHDLWR